MCRGRGGLAADRRAGQRDDRPLDRAQLRPPAAAGVRAVLSEQEGLSVQLLQVFLQKVCYHFFGFLQKEHRKTVCRPECIL